MTPFDPGGFAGLGALWRNQSPVMRGAVNILAMLLLFSALSTTPLAKVTALGFTALKWSQKTGQSAKVYPEPLKGYENGEAPEQVLKFPDFRWHAA